MKKTALLFITTPNLANIELFNPIKDRYFIYINDFIKKQRELSVDLQSYNEITVIILIDACPQQNKMNYCYQSINIMPGILLQNIFNLNHKAIYTILSLSCYGLYIHQHSYLLPNKSKLISLSDYLSSTYKYSIFLGYCLNESSSINIKNILKYYYNHLGTQIAHVFISVNKQGNFRITTLFHQIKLLYATNPFFNCKKIEDFKVVFDQYYVHDKNINEYYLNFFYPNRRKVTKNVYLKAIHNEYRLPCHDSKNYTDPFTIVKQLNLMLHDSNQVKNYFDTIYQKGFTHYDPPQGCNSLINIQIITFLEQDVLLFT